jgi:hypothetical protein
VLRHLAPCPIDDAPAHRHHRAKRRDRSVVHELRVPGVMLASSRFSIILAASVVAACSGQTGAPAETPPGPADGGNDATTTETGAQTPTDAGGQPSACATVQFALTAPAGWTYGQSQDSNSSSINWLTIQTPAGATLDIEPAGDLPLLDCRTCGPAGAIPIGSFWQQVPASGVVTGEWNGALYEPGTCGGHACLTPGCAPAGMYVAELCACANATGACATPTCVAVPFEYPSSSVMRGSVGPADAGIGD